jgi:hypothetical protein
MLVGKPEGKELLGDLGVDGRIILKCMLKELDARVWDGFIWLLIGSGGWLLLTE